MKRYLVLAYGLACYAMFLGVFLYAIGFIGNFGTPTSLDADPARPLAEALMIDLGLLSLFALQHSGMARRGFKRWLTRFVPEPMERAT
ncbi:MAG: isoprenylcysteine carboxylmethyltransferase family protein, partial [Xanthomonadales bacterium]|nr:isoprenylcysteine carboxylmethyltransferase family protein [Xanthomonadales bacterium]